jgi:hypothetical protein
MRATLTLARARIHITLSGSTARVCATIVQRRALLARPTHPRLIRIALRVRQLRVAPRVCIRSGITLNDPVPRAGLDDGVPWIDARARTHITLARRRRRPVPCLCPRVDRTIAVSAVPSGRTARAPPEERAPREQSDRRGCHHDLDLHTHRLRRGGARCHESRRLSAESAQMHPKTSLSERSIDPRRALDRSPRIDPSEQLTVHP